MGLLGHYIVALIMACVYCWQALGTAVPASADPSIDGHLEGSNIGNDVFFRQDSGLPTSSGCFANCYFTLAALRGKSVAATKETKRTEELIRANGGRIFTASLPTSVTAGIGKAFAVCPSSLTHTQIAALKASNPDFAAGM